MIVSPMPEGYTGAKKVFTSTDPWPVLYGAMQNRTILEGEVIGLEPHPMNPELGLCLVIMFNTVKGVIPPDESGEDSPGPGRLAGMVGETLLFKVLRIYRAEKVAILSRRIVKEELSSRTWREIEEGKQVTVTAKAVLPGRGAIVDLGMVPAFLPITEVSWGWVNNLNDFIRPGDTFDVIIKRINKEEQKIFVSLKELLPDPWVTVPGKYIEDGQYQGRVTGFTKNQDVYVQLEDGVSCICPRPLEIKFGKGSMVLVQVRRIRAEKRIIEARFRTVIKV